MAKIGNFAVVPGLGRASVFNYVVTGSYLRQATPRPRDKTLEQVSG